MPLNSRAKCCVINYIAFPGTEHSFEFVYFPGPGVLKSKPSLQKYPIKLAFISTNAEKKLFFWKLLNSIQTLGTKCGNMSVLRTLIFHEKKFIQPEDKRNIF